MAKSKLLDWISFLCFVLVCAVGGLIVIPLLALAWAVALVWFLWLWLVRRRPMADSFDESLWVRR